MGDFSYHHLSLFRKTVNHGKSWVYPLNLEGFSNYEVLGSIIEITNGNSRLIRRLFIKIERILKINQFTLIITEVFEAARDSLVIGLNKHKSYLPTKEESSFLFKILLK